MSKSAAVLIAAAMAVLLVFGAARGQEYALAAPSLTATEVEGRIVLAWTEVDGATRYDLWVRDCENDWARVDDGGLRSPEAIHSNPVDGRRYQYTVQALNDRGEASDWASRSESRYVWVEATVNPIPFPEFEAVPQGDHIQLVYADVEEAAGYQALVWYAGAGDRWLLLPEPDPETRTVAYFDVEPGVDYFFIMRSYSENRCGYSGWSGHVRHTFAGGATGRGAGGTGGVSGSANTATPTPTSTGTPTATPTATPTTRPLPGQIRWNSSSSTHNSVSLSWQAPDPPAAQYQLVLSGSDQTLYEGPATSFSHTGLDDNTAYRYAVRGQFGSAARDWGPWSYETVRTKVDPAELGAYVPGAPATLDARNEPAFGIRLRWRPNARAQPGDCACPVDGHQILRRISGPGQQFQVIATIGTNTYYHDSSASPGVQYTYQVRARNRHGLSAPSGSASATFAPATATPTTTATPTATPTQRPQPGQITWNSSSSTHNSVSLSWQAPDPPATQYQLALSGSGQTLYEGPATSFSHTGLDDNTAYRYAVRGQNGSADRDWGPWSYETVWTKVDPAELGAYVPGAPATLEARNEPAFGIRLRWRPNARAQPGDCACPVNGHQILRRISGSGNQFQVIAAIGTNTYYHDSSASPGVQYTYQVRARNRHGLSAPSGSASATFVPPTATPTPTRDP